MHLLMYTQGALNDAGANLYNARLEAFPVLLLAKVALQERFEDGQKRRGAWHADSEDQEVALEPRIYLEPSRTMSKTRVRYREKRIDCSCLS